MYPFYEIREDSKVKHFTISDAENLSFPPHFHPHVELVYVIEGDILISVNEKKAVLKQGDIAVSFPNDVHSYNTQSFSKIIILIFSPDLISGYFSPRKNKTIDNPFILNNSYDLSIITFITMLREEFESTKDDYVTKGLLYSLFGKLNKLFIIKDNKNLYDTTIQIILKHISKHFSENITLNSVSKDLGYSPFHVSRLFNQKIGYQFNDYINSLRINMSKKLLSETDAAISSIALDCGFESLRSFNRVFKKHLGTTPRDFRNLFRT